MKNSWGTTWGDNGYIYVTRNRTNNRNCRIGASIHLIADSCTVSNCQIC